MGVLANLSNIVRIFFTRKLDIIYLKIVRVYSYYRVIASRSIETSYTTDHSIGVIIVNFTKVLLQRLFFGRKKKDKKKISFKVLFLNVATTFYLRLLIFLSSCTDIIFHCCDNCLLSSFLIIINLDDKYSHFVFIINHLSLI